MSRGLRFLVSGTCGIPPWPGFVPQPRWAVITHDGRSAWLRLHGRRPIPVPASSNSGIEASVGLGVPLATSLGLKEDDLAEPARMRTLPYLRHWRPSRSARPAHGG